MKYELYKFEKNNIAQISFKDIEIINRMDMFFSLIKDSFDCGNLLIYFSNNYEDISNEREEYIRKIKQYIDLDDTIYKKEIKPISLSYLDCVLFMDKNSFSKELYYLLVKSFDCIMIYDCKKDEFLLNSIESGLYTWRDIKKYLKKQSNILISPEEAFSIINIDYKKNNLKCVLELINREC